MSRHGRVLVAMSGGVDSSVAAALLHEEGYEVVGLTMKTWDYATTGGAAEAKARGKEVGCCSLASMNDARAVAVRFGFPHFIVDLREEFGDGVIARFADDYLAGRTPNPCVLCNTHIKWAALLRRADALGCEAIATGHYANVRQDDGPEGTGRWVVSRGLDRHKDQSYALWGVAQAHLARTRFPLGRFTKPAIRAMATDFGLDHVARKPDSYEICFIPDNDYRGFLARRVAGLEARVAGGPFVHEATGAVVGRHRGYPFYTVGQRRGLDLALLTGAGHSGAPVYVTRLDAATNTVFVGPKEALLGKTLTAREVTFGKAAGFADERPALAQIRSRDPGAPCLVRQTEEDAVEVVFDAPRAAIAPGQALVLYDGDDVLAGGWIHTAVASEPERPVLSDTFIALPTL